MRSKLPSASSFAMSAVRRLESERFGLRGTTWGMWRTRLFAMPLYTSSWHAGMVHVIANPFISWGLISDTSLLIPVKGREAFRQFIALQLLNVNLCN